MGCCNSCLEAEEAKIERALLETLKHSARRAVSQASAKGGFANDPEVRIGLPPDLDPFFSKLKMIPGYGAKIQAFEDGLNDAAEEAAAEAEEVLIKAVDLLNFAKVKDILLGEDNAATIFFRSATESDLLKEFLPIVTEKIGHFEPVKEFDKMCEEFSKLPFCTAPKFSVEDYVCHKALDGLFIILAKKEKEIRDDPEARKVNAVLESVFGDPKIKKEREEKKKAKAANEPAAAS